MDDRVVKFRVGVVVVSTMILGGILVLLFGDARWLLRSVKTIHIHFNDAPGVTEGTPVRKSGILIGRVTRVEFADQGGVNVTTEIDTKVKLYRSEVPQVTGSLLGGDVVIQFVKRVRPPTTETSPTATPPTGAPRAAAPPGAAPPGTGPPDAVPQTKTADPAADAPSAQKAAAAKAPPEPADALLQDGDFIQGSVAPSPVQVITNLEGNLSVAIDSLSNAGNEVGKLATYINKMLADNDQQITRIVNKAEQTLDTFQRALANVDDVIGNEKVREDLRVAISELPQLLTDTRGAMNTVRTTVESVDRNLRNLEGFTGPLGDRGEEIVNRADQAIARLDDMLGEMSDFGKKLNSGEGSLGQLMRNPDLYQHLNAAAKNIEQITCQMKPILADARVFSDKIARRPELLGVRGALERSPGTK